MVASSALMNFLRALQFMIRTTARMFPKLNQEEINLGGFPCYLVKARGVSRGTLLFVHGMSVHGFTDERLRGTARGLASIGYDVYCPDFKEVRALEITQRTIQNIMKVIQSLGDSKVGIMAPSFSAGMAIVAAASPKIQARISAICCIGTYASADEVITSFFSQDELDPYGKRIILYNFIAHSIGNRKNVIKAFKIAAEDDGYKRNHLEKHLSKIKPEEVKLFRQIDEQKNVRLAQWKKLQQLVKKKGPLQKLFSSLDVINTIDRISTPIIFIHGDQDTVIPPSQSQLLYERLALRGVRTRICLTPILSHGDSGIGIKEIPAVFALASTFGAFFNEVDQAQKEELTALAG